MRNQQSMNLDLEISIRPDDHESNLYHVNARLSGPYEPVSSPREKPCPIPFPERLFGPALDVKEYGSTLGSTLLSISEIKSLFRKAQGFVESNRGVLHIHLVLSNDKTKQNKLHRIRWEVMRDPEREKWMFVGAEITCSRYLGNPSLRALRCWSSSIRALIAVAGYKPRPDSSPLATIDAQSEYEFVVQSLKGSNVHPQRLDEIADYDICSLDSLIAALNDDSMGYDILYLMCHGKSDGDNNIIFLEERDEKSRSGKPKIVQASEFVEKITHLTPEKQPTLIVLASCESAGEDGEEALAAVGPMLVEGAGIPNVIAMRGVISKDSAKTFISTFFKNLNQSQGISLACGKARADVMSGRGAWAPILFSRMLTQDTPENNSQRELEPTFRTSRS